MLENPDNGQTLKTWALIDTGADSIVVPGFVAKILRHNVDHKSVKKVKCAGVGGSAETFYHTFRINVLSLSPSGVVSDKVAVKISKRELAVAPGLHVVLLGVNDFLGKYLLSIDYPKKMFSVKSP